MILIIDDEASIRRLLRQKLEGAGHQCLELGNTEQAIEIIDDNEVDLVLLDINMPGLSGAELLPKIKAGFPHVSVIMIIRNHLGHVPVQSLTVQISG